MKEIEDIILEKEYFELSAEEKFAMSDLVSNEEEFAEMKWFLNQSQKTVNENLIEPSAELKAGVFAELGNAANKRIWLNGGAGAGVSPTKKKIYQMPAFQIGIAACVVIGFLFFANPFGADKNLALNTTKTDEIKATEEVVEKPVSTEELNQKGIAESPLEESKDELNDNETLIEIEKEEVLKGLENGEERATDRRDIIGGNKPEGTGSSSNIITETDTDTRTEDFAPVDDVTSGDAYNQFRSPRKDKNDEVLLDQISGPIEVEENRSESDYKTSENTPTKPVTATSGAITTTTLESSADEEVADKSSFGKAGNVLSKKKSEEVAKSADVPVLNAVSIAETSELKSLFFTVP